jgi:hypothetical protein
VSLRREASVTLFSLSINENRKHYYYLILFCYGEDVLEILMVIEGHRDLEALQ